MIVVGVDPGLKGGIGILSSPPPENIATYPLTIDAYLAVCRGLVDSECHFFIEKASARPGQGVVSMFNYGYGAGELTGILRYAKIPFTLVPPVEWSRIMHKGTSGKDTKARSIEAAKRLFPSIPTLTKAGLPHLGMVEALLIAEYGRRVLKESPHG